MAGSAGSTSAPPLVDGQSFDFLVTVSMRSQQRLGVDVDWGDGKTLYINAVHPGAIDEWNSMQGPSRTVRNGNRIMAVNGVSADAQAMLRECQAKKFLQLLVRGTHEEPSKKVLPEAEASRAGGGAFIPGAMPTRTVDALIDLRTRSSQQASGKQAAPTKRDPKAPPDYYSLLDVERAEEESGIKRSYRKLVLKWHPDKQPSNIKEAEEKIRLINNAYETLSNPLKRASYDQMLAALDRKRTGTFIETSFIKPRMSIPKEFMLCPLGHPDKFVRILDEGLRVQSRDDVGDMSFTDFFQWAKFSLWWLPEVNNMCRIRVQQSASRGADGGVNLNFMVGVDREDTPKSDVVLSASENPRCTNLIATASPFIEGAFRFEGAFWPNRYVNFRAPSTLQLADLVDEERDVVDFILVDYSAMYKYMTMHEVVARAVQSQGKGSGYVKLGDLRADMSVRVYFQRTLGCPVWNNRDFETFFEGHYEQWDYDQKRARVRLRAKEEKQRDTRKASSINAFVARSATSNNCLTRLQHAEGQGEVTEALLQASEEDLVSLPIDSAASSLARLAENSGAAAREQDLRMARKILLTALPSICEHVGEEGAPISTVLQLHRSTVAMASADSHLSSAAGSARRRLAALASTRLAHAPEEVTLPLLAELFSMPFDWDATMDSLLAMVNMLLATAKVKPGAFLEPLCMAGRAGDKARPIVEALAQWEFQGLPQAQGPVAAEVLIAMAESNVLLSEVAARLRPPILQRLPLPELVRLVALLGEKGVSADALKPALSSRVAVAGPRLVEVPAKHLLQLAVAATKSPGIAEYAVGPVAAAASATLASWLPGDVAELLLVVSTLGATSSGATKLFAEASKVMTPCVRQLDSKQLLRTVLAVNKFMAEASQPDSASCKPLFEAAAEEATQRLHDLRPADLLLLTQGVLSLGGHHPVVVRILDFWAQSLANDAAGYGDLPGDDIAQLVRLVALVAPEHASVFEAFGQRLVAGIATLTPLGRALLDAAFPAGAGPMFASKPMLLQLLTNVGDRPATRQGAATRSRSRSHEPRGSRSRDRSRHKKSRKKSRSRSRSRSAGPSTGNLRGWTEVS